MTSITVVIPVFNDAIMLQTCLDALAAQSRPADDIIVVDNASTDNSAEVARAGGARVIVEPVHGILPATTAGFDAATGDIIARLDADSRPPPDWLVRVARTLNTAGPLSAVTGPGDFYGAGRAVCWLGRVVYIGGYFWFIGALLGHPPLFGSNMAITSGVWARIRPLVDPTLAEVHDDLYVSFRIQPDMTVSYDSRLRVGISARPFDNWSGLSRRLRWAWTTVRMNRRSLSLRQRRAERRMLQRG
jgi:glycosyltransferase involved in cell wall biosynthesis